MSPNMDRCGNGQLDGPPKPESVDSSAAQGWRGPRMSHRRTGGAGWRLGEPLELLSEVRVRLGARHDMVR